MTTKLELHFSRSQTPELESIHFTHLLLPESHTARRGSSLAENKGYVSFRWTPGVQAFCALIIRALLHEKNESSDAELSGVRGSLASTLDVALDGRDLRWVCAMLGKDKSGQAIAKRALAVKNSRLREDGPVRLSLNTSFLPANAIEIYAGSKEICSTEDLAALLRSIEDSIPCPLFVSPKLFGYQRTSKPKPKSGICYMPFYGTVSFETAQSWWAKELTESLGVHNLLDETVHARLIASFENVEWARSLFPLIRSMPSPTNSGPPLRDVAHSLEAKLDSLGGLDVFVGYPGVGAIVLFLFLRETFGLPVRLHYGYEHVFQILEKTEPAKWNPECSVAVLTFAGALHLLKENPAASTLPLMFLPPLSHRVLAKTNGELPDIRSGTFAYYSHSSGIPTGPNIYLGRLASMELVSSSDINVTGVDEKGLSAIAAAADRSTKILAWFPIYRFYGAMHGLTPIDPETGANFVPPLLYMPERFYRNGIGDDLHLALTSAWRILRADSDLRKSQIPVLLSDPSYSNFVNGTVFGGGKKTDWSAAMFNFKGADFSQPA